MRPKIIIISFTVIIGTVLSFYIVGQESKGTNEIDSQVGQKSEPVAQVPNRGEPMVTLKPDYIQIGRLQAHHQMIQKIGKKNNHPVQCGLPNLSYLEMMVMES